LSLWFCEFPFYKESMSLPPVCWETLIFKFSHENRVGDDAGFVKDV